MHSLPPTINLGRQSFLQQLVDMTLSSEADILLKAVSRVSVLFRLALILCGVFIPVQSDCFLLYICVDLFFNGL